MLLLLWVAEFEMSLTSDKYKKEQLLPSTAIPGQPRDKFVWGERRVVCDTVYYL